MGPIGPEPTTGPVAPPLAVVQTKCLFICCAPLVLYACWQTPPLLFYPVEYFLLFNVLPPLPHEKAELESAFLSLELLSDLFFFCC